MSDPLSVALAYVQRCEDSPSSDAESDLDAFGDPAYGDPASGDPTFDFDLGDEFGLDPTCPD